MNYLKLSFRRILVKQNEGSHWCFNVQHYCERYRIHRCWGHISKTWIFYHGKIPERDAKIENRNVEGDKADDLQGEVMKFIILSNIFDIWTKLEVILELKLSRLTHTLTEPSNLIGEIYKKGEIQNERHSKKRSR